MLIGDGRIDGVPIGSAAGIGGRVGTAPSLSNVTLPTRQGDTSFWSDL